MANGAKVVSETVQIALKAAGQAMLEYDAQSGAVAWVDEAAARRVLGLGDDDALDALDVIERTIAPKQVEIRASAVENAKKGGDSYTIEYELANSDNGPTWIEERGTWITFGDTQKLIAMVRRIDEQKEREHRLNYLACYDELTGLLNRMRFKEELETRLGHIHKTRAEGTLFLVGIDDVGSINNDFGFESADEIILQVGKRISEILSDNAIMGRVAGTKFAILFPTNAPDAVRHLSREILNTVRADVFSTRGGTIGVSVCLGAVYLNEAHTNAGIALSQVEAAFDDARMQGRSSFTLFNETTEIVSRRRRNTALTDSILSALNEDRIFLAYQPIVRDLCEVPPKGYECLIRMRGRDGEEIPAPAFIPAAEELGLVHLLDRRVLELATAKLSERGDMTFNVNISWETVRDPVWAEGYLSHLRAAAHVCDRLTIELTETQMVEDIAPSIDFVTAIKGLGCDFAIDDFGAGYTSFRNLKALDIDILKIDGSFITGVSGSRDNQHFVRTLLDLARNFGVQTVAEWVDNEADAQLLKALGVDHHQGFYIGKPADLPGATKKNLRDTG